MIEFSFLAKTPRNPIYSKTILGLWLPGKRICIIDILHHSFYKKNIFMNSSIQLTVLQTNSIKNSIFQQTWSVCWQFQQMKIRAINIYGIWRFGLKLIEHIYLSSKTVTIVLEFPWTLNLEARTSISRSVNLFRAHYDSRQNILNMCNFRLVRYEYEYEYVVTRSLLITNVRLNIRQNNFSIHYSVHFKLHKTSNENVNIV